MLGVRLEDAHSINSQVRGMNAEHLAMFPHNMST